MDSFLRPTRSLAIIVQIGPKAPTDIVVFILQLLAWSMMIASKGCFGV